MNLRTIFDGKFCTFLRFTASTPFQLGRSHIIFSIFIHGIFYSSNYLAGKQTLDKAIALQTAAAVLQLDLAGAELRNTLFVILQGYQFSSPTLISI